MVFGTLIIRGCVYTSREYVVVLVGKRVLKRRKNRYRFGYPDFRDVLRSSSFISSPIPSPTRNSLRRSSGGCLLNINPFGSDRVTVIDS